jgi:hypothetical protein
MIKEIRLTSQRVCQHIKTGSRYWFYRDAENHTSGKDDGKQFIIYAPVSDPLKLAVREEGEFWRKFTIVSSNHLEEYE